MTVTPAACTKRAASRAETTGETDPEVLAFRSQFEQPRIEEQSPLDALVREGARQMLQQAIDAEVEEFLAGHAGRRDAHGHRLVVPPAILQRQYFNGGNIDGRPTP